MNPSYTAQKILLFLKLKKQQNNWQHMSHGPTKTRMAGEIV